MGYKEKEKALEWRRKNTLKNRAFVDRYKLMKGCIDCGYKEHSAALEFDHINGREYKRVGQLICQNSLSAVKKEIRKCELVCSNCHAIREYNRRYF